MTLQISITIPSEEMHPASYLDQQMAALGFIRRGPGDADSIIGKLREHVEQVAEKHEWRPVEEVAQPTDAAVTVKRERGKPCPLSGRKRRTREEVEEDEAAEAAEQAAAGAPTIAHHVTLPADASSLDVAQAFANLSGQQISTGEERVDPASEPEQAVETVAEPKTLEDVKKALGAYVTAFGMAAAQTDGQQIFREALGEPPAGEQAWRMTLIPNDGAKYGAVVAAVYGAIELNPYKRERVA